MRGSSVESYAMAGYGIRAGREGMKNSAGQRPDSSVGFEAVWTASLGRVYETFAVA